MAPNTSLVKIVDITLVSLFPCPYYVVLNKFVTTSLFFNENFDETVSV